ncbi:hypothetical protein ACO1C0_12560 [Bacillus velezensis]
MSEIFSHFIQHFDRYFILSRQSVLIIQWSAVCLAVLYALTFHSKISRERVWFYSGILLRAVLLAGITVELVHQVQSTRFSAHYLISEERELLPIVHLLIYGYVLLTAFYYMLMPQKQRGKGIFYTFDLTVVTLPVIQLIFSFFAFWNNSPDAMAGEDIVSMLCFITVVLLLLISMNVLFFKMYWKPRPVFIGVFYAGVIGLLVWVLSCALGRCNKRLRQTSPIYGVFNDGRFSDDPSFISSVRQDQTADEKLSCGGNGRWFYCLFEPGIQCGRCRLLRFQSR